MIPLRSTCARILTVLFLAFGSAGQAQEVLTGIAAQVNNEVITFGQLRVAVAEREYSARAKLSGAAQVEEIKKIRLAALNELIDRSLILQEFERMQKKEGANIPEHILDEHIETIIREQFGNDRAAFLRTLEAQNFTLERFRQREKEKIIIQAMRGQKMGHGNGIIAEPRIREYYENSKNVYASKPLSEVRDEIEKKLSQEDRQKQQREWLDKLRSKAFIKIF